MTYKKKRNPAGFTGNRAVDISILLERVLDKNKISDNMNFQVLVERFQDIVGPLVFPHVNLLKLEHRILTLKADSSTWKSEINLQKKAIIDKCNLVLGKPAVRDVRLI